MMSISSTTWCWNQAAFYIMDRGYLDFGRLYTFTEQAAFFVIRAKRNLAYRRRASQTVDKNNRGAPATSALS